MSKWKHENNQYLYCTWAYRYSDKQGYNFPVGIFSTYERAEQAAQKHRDLRGGKYDHLIYRMPIDLDYDAEEAVIARGFIQALQEGRDE